MKLLTIASREIADRKLLWAAALFTGIMGEALPWMKGLSAQERQETRIVLGAGMVWAFVWAVSAVLGAAMLPGDIAGRRIGFHLARPVSMGTLVGGTFLGAWVLTAGGGLVVALCLVPFQPHEWGALLAMTGVAAATAIPILLLFHILGIAWHARSPWVLLSLSSLWGFGWSMGWCLKRIVTLGSLDAVPWFLGGVAALVTVVLALAVYLQMEKGRAGLRRGHVVMSITLAAGLLAVGVLGALFTGWAGSGGPGTLTDFHTANIAPKGDWIYLTGTGRMHGQAFLLNAATGEKVDRPHGGRFSGDGLHFVSVESHRPMLRVIDVNLGVTPARVTASGEFAMDSAPGVSGLEEVSQDGRLALISLGHRMIVADVRTGLKVQEIAGEKDGLSRFTFPAPGTLRAYQPRGDDALEILELDFATARWATLGHALRKKGFRLDSGQLLINDEPGFQVCDGRTGAVLGSISPTANGRLTWPRRLADGSYVVVETTVADSRLRVVDATGKDVWSQPLKGPGKFLPFPEAGSNRIYVNALDSTGHEGRLWLADPTAKTLALVSETSFLALGDWNREPLGTLASRLRVGNGGGLALWGPDGKPRAVVPGGRWVPN